MRLVNLFIGRMMIESVEIFKKQQNQIRILLIKLYRFIEKVNDYGLNKDKQLLEKLDKALKVADEKKLKVALIGGFSEGKTSIASAWLGKLDQSMNISQKESTNEINVYNLEDDIELIDTPGLFGYKEQKNNLGEIEKFKEITKKYISEVHLVLYIMNSANPIKESHQEELRWLFRELKLLPRTVFVLSRFDEVADIEDNGAYSIQLNIKKNNVIARLKDLINLCDDEYSKLQIVGVSANPFGEGLDYWLNNLEEFNKISYIYTLQNATKQIIIDCGGMNDIVLDAQRTVINDVLGRQLPSLCDEQENLSKELLCLTDAVKHLEEKMVSTEKNMIKICSNLEDFIIDHFNSLIQQLEGTEDLITLKNFYTREIGDNNKLLDEKLEREFKQQIQSISFSLKKINLDFNNEIDRLRMPSNLNLLKKICHDLLSNIEIKNIQVLWGRDKLNGFGRLLGTDLSKNTKFRPYGAVKLAKKLNNGILAIDLAYEVYDSYKKYQYKKIFNNKKENLQVKLKEEKERLLQLFKNDNFINELFPMYKSLQERFVVLKKTTDQAFSRKQALDELRQEGIEIKENVRSLKLSE